MSDVPRRSPRLLPALLLILLAPIIAEASIGTAFVPSGGFAFLVLMPIYGGGALLIREIVARRQAGYVAVAVLGVGYGIVEEGLALGSFFSPTIYEGIGPLWGGRILELNTVYTLFQLLNHSLFSVTLPVLLVELCFPSQQHRPWLRVPGLIFTTLLFLSGFAILRLSTVFSFDPGYQAPTAWIAGAVVVLALAVALTRRAASVLYPTHQESMTPPPNPLSMAALALGLVGAALAVLGVGGDLGAFSDGGPALTAAIVAFLVSVTAGTLLVLRWSQRNTFDDRHRLGLGAGALLAHSVVLGVIHPTSPSARAGVAAVLVMTLVLLGLLWRFTAKRHSIPHTTTST